MSGLDAHWAVLDGLLAVAAHQEMRSEAGQEVLVLAAAAASAAAAPEFQDLQTAQVPELDAKVPEL